MKNLPNKKFFLFILSSLSFAFSHAQNLPSSDHLFIVTDFQNCGTGLKDSTGKWIVQPTYQEITNLGYGFYNVLSGSKEGVVTGKGQVLIPAIYDNVDMRFCRLDSAHVKILFSISNNGKEGVIDQFGNFVIAPECRSIRIGKDGHIIAETRKKRYSIYYPDGTHKDFSKKMNSEPEYVGDHLVIVGRNAFGLTSGDYSWFPQIKQKYGVVNDSLKEIIPEKYSSISYSSSQFNKYNLIRVERKGKTGFYNTDGKLIWAPIFSNVYSNSYSDGFDIDGYYGYQLAINTEGYAFVKYKNKYGMISGNGDTLLPFIYDDIFKMSSRENNFRSENWFVIRNGMKGIYNPNARKWILPVEYSSIKSMQNYTVKNDTSIVDIFIVKKNGKCGMFSSCGQEIMPAIYDDYYYIDDGMFFVNGNNCYAVTFPKCLKPHSTIFFSYNDELKSIVTELPSNKLLQKIERPDGTVLFINPDLISDSLQKSYYKIKEVYSRLNPQTYDSLLHATAIIIMPLKPISEFAGVGPEFEFPNMNLSIPTYGTPTKFCWLPNSPDQIQHITHIAYDSNYEYFDLKSYGIFRSDGKKIFQPGQVKWIDKISTTNELAVFRITTMKKKVGLIDGNGKILVDTVWTFLGTEINGNCILASNKKERMIAHEYYLNILDTSSNQLLLSKKNRVNGYTTLGKEAASIETENGPQLLNYKTRKFVFKGNINNLLSLDSEKYFFAARTCSGKIGIVDGNGKWLADTVWTALILTSDDSGKFGHNYYYSSFHSHYFVLSNDTGWVIFDGRNKRLTKDPATINYLLNKSENGFKLDTSTNHGYHCMECPTEPAIQKFCDQCPSWYFGKNSSAENLLPWQSSILFDSLFTGETFVPDTDQYWHLNSCKECMKRNVPHDFYYEWGKNYDQSILNHTIRFANDSVISVTRENLSHSYGYANKPSDLFFTVMLFKDGPHAMLLDSLFTGTEWKKMISTEVMNYLDSSLDITGNCSNPYMMPLVLKNRFSISKDGIMLYPPSYKEKGNQLAILVTWKKLEPYLRKDVSSKLGIKK